MADPQAQSGSSFDLSGRTALVTGGTDGIGLAIAAGLVHAGARVVIAARDAAKGEAAAASLGNGVVFLRADLADADACSALPERCREAAGPVHILVNNVGMNIAGRPEALDPADWFKVMQVNAAAPFLVAQAAHPQMKASGGGKVINVASLASLFGSVNAAYAASKGAVAQLTRSLAVAWGRDNIQVNAILPGYIETELMRSAVTANPGLKDRILARTPMGRIGQPQDCAGLAVFLASPASDFLTGALIPLDGGYSVQM